jgi:hypothetical protein
MSVTALLLGLATLGLSPPSNTAATAVTFRDGKVALGDVVDTNRPRGSPMILIIRRAWAEEHLPDRAALWEKTEAASTRQAEALRRQRLAAWRRDRPRDPAGGDRITPWIDRELARLDALKQGEKSVLMLININRADVKSVGTRPRNSSRMLRLGWLSDLPEVETMPLEELERALEGRGFDPLAESLVSVDSLLPLRTESNAQWLVRRASTEVANDPGGRFLVYKGLVVPEPGPGEAPPAATSLNAALSGLKELLGEVPTDPLPGKLRELSAKGRIGAVVTRLELSPDLASVAVETTLWVRTAGDRWAPSMVRSSTVRPDDLPANAGEGLADDPQVKAAFGVVESLGLGEIPPEFKRRSLNMGAATRKALGQARGALDQELNSAILSLEPARDRVPAPNPAAKP